MFKIVAIMLSGVVVGYLLRNKNLSFVPRLITIAIWVLLFMLGLAVGLNDAISEQSGYNRFAGIYIECGRYCGKCYIGLGCLSFLLF